MRSLDIFRVAFCRLFFIEFTPDGATTEKKAQLIAGVTKLLQDVLDKNPQTTVVVIEEVDTDNWGIGGESVTVRRARGQ